jgi:hypothetical protein
MSTSAPASPFLSLPVQKPCMGRAGIRHSCKWAPYSAQGARRGQDLSASDALGGVSETASETESVTLSVRCSALCTARSPDSLTGSTALDPAQAHPGPQGKPRTTVGTSRVARPSATATTGAAATGAKGRAAYAASGLYAVRGPGRHSESKTRRVSERRAWGASPAGVGRNPPGGIRRSRYCPRCVVANAIRGGGALRGPSSFRGRGRPPPEGPLRVNPGGERGRKGTLIRRQAAKQE